MSSFYRLMIAVSLWQLKSVMLLNCFAQLMEFTVLAKARFRRSVPEQVVGVTFLDTLREMFQNLQRTNGYNFW